MPNARRLHKTFVTDRTAAAASQHRDCNQHREPCCPAVCSNHTKKRLGATTAFADRSTAAMHTAKAAQDFGPDPTARSVLLGLCIGRLLLLLLLCCDDQLPLILQRMGRCNRQTIHHASRAVLAVAISCHRSSNHWNASQAVSTCITPVAAVVLAQQGTTRNELRSRVLL